MKEVFLFDRTLCQILLFQAVIDSFQEIELGLDEFQRKVDNEEFNPMKMSARTIQKLKVVNSSNLTHS